MQQGDISDIVKRTSPPPPHDKNSKDIDCKCRSRRLRPPTPPSEVSTLPNQKLQSSTQAPMHCTSHTQTQLTIFVASRSAWSTLKTRLFCTGFSSTTWLTLRQLDRHVVEPVTARAAPQPVDAGWKENRCQDRTQKGVTCKWSFSQ
eukprot:3238909-Rhodomonas_salina.1